MTTRDVGIALFLILYVISPTPGLALETVTHEIINEVISTGTSGFQLDSYLKKHFGSEKGIKAEINKGTTSKKSWEWLAIGGKYEDAPPLTLPYRRSVNHFHDPITNNGYAGLWGIGIMSGTSSIHWAQKAKGTQSPESGLLLSLGGNYSWYDTRDYFYKALSLKEKKNRDQYSAEMFRGVGQLMHLVQDSSVPAHVRNDGHAGYHYEIWVKNNINTKAQISAIAPVAFDKTILNFAQNSAPLPIVNIIDTNQYDGSKNVTNSSFIGLSEYSNANFFSEDTIFRSYPHPHRDNTNFASFGLIPITITTKVSEVPLNTLYIEGYGKKHLAGFKYFAQEIEGLSGRYELRFILDDRCYSDYAAELLPHAVGYSAGLLNYFFRGDMRLEYTTSPTPGYVIVNKTDEDMDGLFQILYDNNNDERAEYMSGNFGVKANGKGDVFNITTPADAKEPGKYTLVFKGTMGNEKGAVAGYVTSRLLEITPPEQFIYSMVDMSKADPYFRRIRAKIKNRSTSEQMGSGTVQAIAKYKMNTYDVNFIYSMSETKAIDLSSNATVEVEFSFEKDPIPLGVTDLYLEVVFKGAIGSETNAVASGIKDISEPTPIDLFNYTDKSCVNGNWYPTAGAIDLMDTSSPKDHIADTWDVNPHMLQNIYIKISSLENPQVASPSLYNAVVPDLNPGQFKRAVYILTDHKFKYSFYSTWRPSPGFIDHWVQSNNVHTFSGTALKDQTDYLSDPAVCGKDPWCYIHRYPVYYSLRGNAMWWAGGVVFINAPYPENSSCQGY